MTSLSTHVLDTEIGKPAAGVRVTLSTEDQAIADAETGPDGRIADLGQGTLTDGSYVLAFDVAAYLAREGRPAAFLQRVSIEFHVDQTQTHYHVPLLITPFACTSYRGS